MENLTEKDIDHIKQLIFSDTPELAFEMISGWDKTLIRQHFEIECTLFPLLCLQYFPFLLEGYAKFNLEARQIQALPPQVGELKFLDHLMLQDNMLSDLPEELGQIEYLKHLNLSFNCFEVFPEVIGALKNLRTLNMEHNDLGNISDSIGNLRQLISLDLNDNKIAHLPETMANLTQLKSLEIINNPIPEEEINQLRTQLPNCEIRH
ncbi:hypothetical protein BKI52_03605 [marine bacterium AO1-C]|nr:hypothetical protein BKI52_03605 [marine bacterium AO1-C]